MEGAFWDAARYESTRGAPTLMNNDAWTLKLCSELIQNQSITKTPTRATSHRLLKTVLIFLASKS